MNTEMPKLMIDDSENDGKAEIVMDYVLSWCLRRASVICANEKPVLYKYCRNMLGILLQINIDDSIIFKSVKVWKEEFRIDLWVEVVIEKENKEEKHAILIENKYYSGLHETRDKDKKYRNQLEVYKRRFNEYYDNLSEVYELHYVLITCIARNDPKFKIYDIEKSFGFSIFSFYELLGEEREYEESESDLFNEFWIRWKKIICE